MREITMPRLVVATLALMLTLPSGAMAQDESYTLAELEQRCEDNTISSDARDTCLAVLHLIVAPEADKELPDDPPDPASAGDIPGTGIFIVGMDVAPGTYRTPGPVSGSCYYARLSGFSGTLIDVIANGNAGGPAVVTVSPSDAAFETSRCQPWVAVDVLAVAATPRPTIPTITTTKPSAAPSPIEQPKRRFYRVKAGDTFAGVAIKFRVKPQHLQCINGIQNRNILVLGAKLEIPPEGFTCPRGWRNATPEP